MFTIGALYPLQPPSRMQLITISDMPLRGKSEGDPAVVICQNMYIRTYTRDE